MATAFILSNGLFFAQPKHTDRVRNSCFRGEALKRCATPPIKRKSATVFRMAVDPWSVSSEAMDVFAAQSFAASLFPYLGFLYFLGKKEVGCPRFANFGFQFLLAFVFASIPAGIYAKVHYGDILANVDWLHGCAESLLTLTNLFVVLGFREAFKKQTDDSQPKGSSWTAILLGGVSVGAFWAVPSLVPTLHAEPTNALSFPTWIIHVSSLLEWLAAMGLVWNYSYLTGDSRWKGLTWGMLPLHTSGLCACTYHLFYNAPSLNILVAIQALLTFFGNCTLCFASFRIFSGKRQENQTEGTNLPNLSKVSFESDNAYFVNLLIASCVGSAAVKWGALYVDAPFQPSLALAFAFITIPSALNVAKWLARE